MGPLVGLHFSPCPGPRASLLPPVGAHAEHNAPQAASPYWAARRPRRVQTKPPPRCVSPGELAAPRAFLLRGSASLTSLSSSTGAPPCTTSPPPQWAAAGGLELPLPFQAVIAKLGPPHLPPRFLVSAAPLLGTAELNLFVAGDTHIISSPRRVEHSRCLLSCRPPKHTTRLSTSRTAAPLPNQALPPPSSPAGKAPSSTPFRAEAPPPAATERVTERLGGPAP